MIPRSRKFNVLIETPGGRLRLLLAYTLFVLLLRMPLQSLISNAAATYGQQIALLILKISLSILIPALFVYRLIPDTSVLRLLAIVPNQMPLKVGRAFAIALAYAALLVTLTTWQAGRLPQLSFAGSLGALLLMLVHILVEEIGARGFILSWLSKGRPFWRANLIASALFVAMHIGHWYHIGMRWEMLPSAIAIFVMSLVLGYVTCLSGTMWIAFALHLFNNILAGN
jgi:membrane protease YdiL (CAAX protease family)